MFNNNVTVIRIPQLKDNYSYIIKDNETNEVVIVDPANATTILDHLKKNNLKLIAILITHHHADHTMGINDLLSYFRVPVYSPNKKIAGTTKVVFDNDIIELNFIKIKVITAPGHTLDHVVYYNKINNILFSGDVLFRLGCGRIFEGSYEIMYQSLKKIEKLSDATVVYCGHEYTLNNINFLISLFPEYKALKIEKDKINNQILKDGSSIPFSLGMDKKINPFLSSQSIFYEKFRKRKKFTNFELFVYLRELKDKF